MITEFVEALQEDDIDDITRFVDLEAIRDQPSHSYTVESLRSLFADIDVSQIAISKPSYDKTTKIIRIRMTKPLSLDFDLQHQNVGKGNGKGDFYRIIGIHP